MFKELAKYIVDLAVLSEKTEVIDIEGEKYVNGKRLMPDYASSIELNTLDASIDFLNTTCKSGDFTYPLIVSATHNGIEAFSSLDKYKKRELILQARPVLPRIDFNQYMDLESFIIQLQTCFVDTKNKTNLLDLVASFVESETLEVSDNGISQTVSIEKGAGIKSKNQLQIDPFIRLSAYRTYGEVEQPETIYLLRVQQGNRVALFESDGGKWKSEAQKNVAEYLKKGLKELVDEGKIVVIG